ncbi:MAG TPA: hypothetical protein PJ991_11365 [Kiritimatiellia bacterium]|nr:hypothetical protein [Kiritimatiellia bacterium]
MRKFLVSLFCTISPQSVSLAQVTEAWFRHYNAGVWPYAEAMAVDSNGNTFAVGAVGIGMNADLLTVRYDADGVLQWANTYDSGFQEYEWGQSLAVDHEGNVYASGYSTGFDYSDDMVVIKYDADGAQLWADRYTPAHSFYHILDMTVSEERDLYLTGQHYTSMRYSPTGTRQWLHFDPNASSADNAMSIATDSSGNAVVTGTLHEHPLHHIHTIKYTPAGAVSWSRRYPPSGGSAEGLGVALHDAGHVVVTGGGTQGVHTILYQANGDELWVRTLEGSDTVPWARSFGVNVAFDPADDIVVSARLDIPGWNDCDTAILKYDLTGNLLWTQTYAGVCSGDLRMALDDQGNIYTVSGLHDGTLMVVKVSASGQIVWSEIISMPGDWLRPLTIGLDRDRNVYVGANNDDSGGFIIVKYLQEASGEPPGILDYAPEDGAVGVDRLATVYAVLESDNDLNPDSFVLDISTIGQFIVGHPAVVWDGNILSFVPTEDLPLGDYGEDVTVSLSVADVDGNATNFTWSFTLHRRVEVVAIELTQGLQNWKNERLSMVANKRTLVRVHMESPDATEFPLAVDGLLHGRHIDNGPALPGSPIKPVLSVLEATFVSTNAVQVRHDIDQSLNFDLPLEWTTNSIFVLEVEVLDVKQINLEPASVHSPAGDGQVFALFSGAIPLPLVVTPIELMYTNTLRPAPTLEMVARNIRAMESVFPIERVNWRLSPTIRFDAGKIGDGADLGAVLAQLTTISHFVPAIYDRKALVYGTFDPVQPLGGLADRVSGRVSVGTFVPVFPDVMMHEIAHTLGLDHPVDTNQFGVGECTYSPGYSGAQGSCGECGDYDEAPFPFYHQHVSGQTIAGIGTYPATPEKLIYITDMTGPELRILGTHQATELMGYCSIIVHGLQRWPSTYSYDRLSTAISARYYTEMAPASLSRSTIRSFSEPTSYLMVRGFIHVLDEEAVFSSTLRISLDTPPDPEPPGNFVLEARDAADQVVSSISFEPIGGTGNNVVKRPFVLLLPDDPAIRSFVIRKNGDSIGLLEASPEPPWVTLLSPDGGESYGGATIPVAWAGGDADGDPLTYALFYSHDGGQSWLAVAVDLEDETYDVPRDALSGSTNARMRVTASDGFWTTSAESDGPFTSADHAPQIIWIHGEPGQAVVAGRASRFQVMVYDVEDGVLSGSDIVWVSDVDGPLGTGETVMEEMNSLSIGLHQIQVIATDSDGNATTSSIPVQVQSHRSPVIWNLDFTPGAAPRLRGFADAQSQLTLETSTNVYDWVPAFTALHRGVLFELPTPSPTNGPLQLYRIKSLPAD